MPYKQGLEAIGSAYTASFLLLGHGGLCGSKLDSEKEKHHEKHHQIHTRTWSGCHSSGSSHISGRGRDPLEVE
jgi:hypothetical protein